MRKVKGQVRVYSHDLTVARVKENNIILHNVVL